MTTDAVGLKHALVTGASSGIGAACVDHLAGLGLTVWATFRDPAQAAAATRGPVRGLVLDLDDPGSPGRMAETFLRESGGRLDALVHAAGYVQPGLLEWIRPEDLMRQLEVNVVGAHAVTRALLPGLRAAKGRAVWISSVSGRVSLPGIGAYAASKFALEAMADAWRLELVDDGVVFTLVEPGPVETPIWDKADRALAKSGEQADPTLVAVMRERLRESQSRAVPVGEVVDAVMRVLAASRPPARVLLSREAWALRFLRILPDAWRDALVVSRYRKLLGLPRGR